MVSTMIDDVIPEEYQARLAITDARRAFELAELRCISVDRLIERVVGLVSEKQSSEIVYAIEERSLTDEQDSSLVLALQALLLTVDSARGIDKDVLIGGLGGCYVSCQLNCRSLSLLIAFRTGESRGARLA